MRPTFLVLGLVVPMLSFAAADNDAAGVAPTFNRDVAPILYKNCSTCHHPGEVAPFSLLTYDDAAKRAKQIATITQERVMPPWKAEPGYGDFQNERRLTDRQLATLAAWAANGAPEGDPSLKPAPPSSPAAGKSANRIRWSRCPSLTRCPRKARTCFAAS